MAGAGKRTERPKVERRAVRLEDVLAATRTRVVCENGMSFGYGKANLARLAAKAAEG